jgi:invasion protein IalB
MRVALVALIAAAPAAAEVRNGAAFGDWTVTCTAETSARTLCALTQTVVARNGGGFLAEIGLNPGEGGVVMVLRTPSGTLLPVQPAYRVGAAAPQPLAWRTCAGDFCTALRRLDPPEVDALRRGRSMVIGYHRAGEAAPVAFEASLNGVTAGLAALGAR